MYGNINLDSYVFHLREKNTISETPFSMLNFSTATMKDFILGIKPRKFYDKKIIFRLPKKDCGYKAIEYFDKRIISGYFYVGFFGRGTELGDETTAMDLELTDTEQTTESNVNFIPYFYYIHIPTDPTDKHGQIIIQRNGRNGAITFFENTLDDYFKENFKKYKFEYSLFVYDETVNKFSSKFVKSFIISKKKEKKDKTDLEDFDTIKITMHVNPKIGRKTTDNIVNLCNNAIDNPIVKALGTNEEFLDIIAVLGEKNKKDQRVSKVDNWNKFKPESDIDDRVAKSNGNPVFKSIKSIAEELLNDITK